MEFKIAIFDNVQDRHPKPLTVDWSRFVAKAQAPIITPTKERNGLFSPVLYRAGAAERKNANVEAITAVVMDVDHDADLHETWGYVREMGWEAMVYTSYSHRQNGEDKFRLIFPLAVPCPADTQLRLWHWLNDELGGIADPAAKDLARMFFWPAKSSESAPYFTAAVDGERLDYRALSLPPEAPADPKLHAPVVRPAHYTPTLNDAGARTLFDSWVSRCENAVDGEKWATIVAGGYCLGGLVGAGRLDASEAEIALYEAIVSAGAKDRVKARKDIRKALERGARVPLYAPAKQAPMERSRVIAPSDSDAPVASTEISEPDYQMEWLDEHEERLLDYLQAHNRQRTSTTGFANLDALFRPVRPALTIITGQPNAGKSSMLDTLLMSIVREQDWKFGIVSFETQPIDLHKAILIGFYTDKQYYQVTREDIREASARIGRNFAFHIVSPAHRTKSGVLHSLKRTHDTHKLDAVVLDPFTELQFHEAGKYEMQTRLIQASLSDFRQFAYDSTLHFFLVIHPSKNPDRSESARNTILTLEDGSGSKAFHNIADYGITVHREITENQNEGWRKDQTSIHLTKVRRGFPGRRGYQNFAYRPEVGDYIEGDSEKIGIESRYEPVAIPRRRTGANFYEKVEF